MVCVKTYNIVLKNKLFRLIACLRCFYCQMIALPRINHIEARPTSSFRRNYDDWGGGGLTVVLGMF